MPMHTGDPETAPDFTLTDTHGTSVRLSDFRGRQPVVLVFLRGLR